MCRTRLVNKLRKSHLPQALISSDILSRCVLHSETKPQQFTACNSLDLQAIGLTPLCLYQRKFVVVQPLSIIRASESDPTKGVLMNNTHRIFLSILHWNVYDALKPFCFFEDWRLSLFHSTKLVHPFPTLKPLCWFGLYANHRISYYVSS